MRSTTLRVFILAPVIAFIIVALFATVSAPIVQAVVDHCPAGGVKDDSGDDSELVLPAGLTICVKASTGNTGMIQTDGTSTLRDYLHAAGINGGDGEGRDASYFVIYTEQSESPSPSIEPSVEPSVEPSIGPDPTSSIDVPEVVTPTPEPVPNTAINPEDMDDNGSGPITFGGILVMAGLLWLTSLLMSKPKE